MRMHCPSMNEACTIRIREMVAQMDVERETYQRETAAGLANMEKEWKEVVMGFKV